MEDALRLWSADSALIALIVFGQAVQTLKPCMWNGRQRPCFLFARKFLPETGDVLLELLPSVTWPQAHQLV